MKNFSKQFAAFAMVFTMGTATTTTSAEATCHHWGGCHHNSCDSLKYQENKYRNKANHYPVNSWYHIKLMNKSNHFRNQYNQYCQITPTPTPTPTPSETGTVCGYVLGNGAGLDGILVEITNADGTITQTQTNHLGKWSISTIPAGQVSIYVNEDDVRERAPEGEPFIPVQVENSNTIIVEANKINDGGLDSWCTSAP